MMKRSTCLGAANVNKAIVVAGTIAPEQGELKEIQKVGQCTSATTN
jgi:hypothetical protein